MNIRSETSSCKGRGVFLSLIVGLGLLFAAKADHAAPASMAPAERSAQSCPEEGVFTVAQAEGQPPSGEVQERAVPPNLEGVMVQGNQLRAMPGYVLERGVGNQVVARHKAGGGQDKTLNCGCRGGEGECTIGWSEDQAFCFIRENNPCRGKCEWYYGPPSKVGPPSRR